MIKCEQCMQCENVDNDMYEYYCPIISPEPIIVDGMCNRFEDHALFGGFLAEKTVYTLEIQN